MFGVAALTNPLPPGSALPSNPVNVAAIDTHITDQERQYVEALAAQRTLNQASSHELECGHVRLHALRTAVASQLYPAVMYGIGGAPGGAAPGGAAPGDGNPPAWAVPLLGLPASLHLMQHQMQQMQHTQQQLHQSVIQLQADVQQIQATQAQHTNQINAISTQMGNMAAQKAASKFNKTARRLNSQKALNPNLPQDWIRLQLEVAHGGNNIGASNVAHWPAGPIELSTMSNAELNAIHAFYNLPNWPAGHGAVDVTKKRFMVSQFITHHN
eukprot:TRINITY_DN11564_c0_g1_i1.p1 TRINITY_DN11564_c0_g1~~TRINITY_DN11564_c0_g1_i1.p1  ORF type:complete len:271 (+),score=46.37 TRINITY_DN11564_c0_g1_i1:54-866(+)